MKTHASLSGAVREFSRLSKRQREDHALAYVYPNRADVDEGHDYEGFAMVPRDELAGVAGESYLVEVDPSDVAAELEDLTAGDADDARDRERDALIDFPHHD